MSYLLSDGKIVKDIEYSVMDFLKANLLFPKGAAFNSFDYGYTYFNPSDVDSIKEQINALVQDFGYNLTVESIEVIQDKYITVVFKGIKDKIIITNEA